MNTFLRTRFLAAAALALGALGGASAAHAGSDLSFFVGIQAPPTVYVQPAPVYVQPRSFYVQPAQVYMRPAEPIYQYSYRDERARRHAAWREWQWRQRHHQQDRDHDRPHGRNWD